MNARSEPKGVTAYVFARGQLTDSQPSVVQNKNEIALIVQKAENTLDRLGAATRPQNLLQARS